MAVTQKVEGCLGPTNAATDDLAYPAYDPAVLGVFGFGPGLTLLMGLPPLTPSAIRRRMSISTSNFDPCMRTTIPFICVLPSVGEMGVVPLFTLKRQKSGQTRPASGGRRRVCDPRCHATDYDDEHSSSRFVSPLWQATQQIRISGTELTSLPWNSRRGLGRPLARVQKCRRRRQSASSLS